MYFNKLKEWTITVDVYSNGMYRKQGICKIINTPAENMRKMRMSESLLLGLWCYKNQKTWVTEWQGFVRLGDVIGENVSDRCC